MSRTLFGKNGNYWYLYGVEEGCCWKFDGFGTLVSDTALISNTGGRLKDVKCISVLMSGGTCEILYEGMVCEIRKSLTEMVSLLKSRLPVVGGMVLRRKYVKEHCMQAILPLEVCTSLADVKQIFGSCNWRKL